MSDLVEGLREASSGKGGLDYGDLWAYCDEAADEIESLEAELAEARRDAQALKQELRREAQALKQELREATEACGDPRVNITHSLPECVRALESERKALLHTVMEVRGILHACGRRPEACHEMSILDDAIDAARGKP
jgi:DNA repair exonuclease SbcCD ATPase subunit